MSSSKGQRRAERKELAMGNIGEEDERLTCNSRVDEEQTTMNSSISDVAVTHGRQFLT